MAKEPTRAAVSKAWVMLQQAAVMQQTAVDARLRSAGLNWSRAAVLAVLRAHGPQPMRSLARYLLIQNQSLTDLIDRLERAGLVERTRHPTDRRVVLVALTAAGTAAAAVADTALAEVAATVLAGAAPADVTHLTALLAQVRDRTAETAGIPTPHFRYATETLALRGDPAA
jgi:DNA-binding MarR family transcriptional regulator